VRLLDLFCGAGGCSVGYHRAGFEVVGVDHRPMPRYPFAFVQADALEYLAAHGREYDAIHASPPCHEFSSANRHRLKGRYPDLIGPCRELLETTGRPWVMENVVGAPLRSPALLCGSMFGLGVIRHRLFESNVLLMTPTHPRHGGSAGSHRGRSGNPRNGCRYVTVTTGGNGVRLADRRSAMGVGWMNWDELAQAIPPAYAEFVGRQLAEVIRNRQAA
jgi:DNA (cytosine-5)-methyltransferase 1